jgi:hypothetical protein
VESVSSRLVLVFFLVPLLFPPPPFRLLGFRTASRFTHLRREPIEAVGLCKVHFIVTLIGISERGVRIGLGTMGRIRSYKVSDAISAARAPFTAFVQDELNAAYEEEVHIPGINEITSDRGSSGDSPWIHGRRKASPRTS